MTVSPQAAFRPLFLVPYHGRKLLQFSSCMEQINHDWFTMTVAAIARMRQVHETFLFFFKAPETMT
jgi:hypothetical protein